jgi:mannose-1-phosphate guanylyltransferase
VEKAPDNAYAVILAGGGGTRLWPKSRKKLPKHLLKLFGKETLLRAAYDRLKPIFPREKIFIVSLWEYRDLVCEQLTDFPKENIIIEPEAKNTALAIGTAAAYIYKENPEAIMINLPADSTILEEEKFQKTVLQAINVASKGEHIVTIGIRPTFPHTGLGYIRIGDELDDFKRGAAFKCKGFKEKPNLVTAQSFVATGRYLWNAGMYCFSVKTILEAFKKHSPSVNKSVQKILEAIDTPEEKKVLAEVYEKASTLQIDTEVSEKADNIVVVPGDFTWSDVGDWNAVYDIQKKDRDKNVIIDPESDFVGIDTKNSLIQANGRLIVTIGLENMVVVDTKDALLICPKDRTQDVKKVVEKLKEEKKDRYL